MEKENIVPIEEAKSKNFVSNKLILPEYMHGKIGVSLTKTEKLLGITGMGLVLYNSEDRARVEPTILGIDGQGNALAGGTKSKSKSEAERLIVDLSMISKIFDKRLVALGINTQEIANSIHEDSDNNLRSPKAWAKHLNKNVADTVKKEGTNLSLTPSRFMSDYVLDFNTLWPAGFVATGNSGNEIVTSVLTTLVFLPQVLKVFGKMKLPEQAKPDILYSMNIGRAAWLNFRARTAYRDLIVEMKDN